MTKGLDHIDKRAMMSIEGAYNRRKVLEEFSIKYSEIFKTLHETVMPFNLVGGVYDYEDRT